MKIFVKQVLNRYFKSFFLLLFLTSLIFTNCNIENAYTDTFRKIKNINLAELKLNVKLSKPGLLIVFGNYIILEDPRDDNFLVSLIDNKTGSELIRFGQRGRGPGEIGGISRIVKNESDSIYIYDYTDSELLVYSTTMLLSGNNLPIAELKFKDQLEKIVRIHSLVPLKKGNWITTGLYLEGRFAVHNKDGIIENYQLDYPQLDLNTNDVLSRASFYQSYATLHPDKNLIATVASGIVDIIAIKEDTLKLVSREKAYKNKLSAVNSNGTIYSAFTNESIIGLDPRSISSSSKGIFLLYSPKTFGDYSKGCNNAITFKDVCFYNWKGEKSIHFILDREVLGMSISSDENFLYFLGLNEDMEPTIYTSKLPTE